ncbi:DUF861 domain-containing protein [Burkholderiaceae bacterium DAT-1]|nr:DUF861 domain-containing protein [Burkholderiaceae bacterium DAT-1]
MPKLVFLPQPSLPGVIDRPREDRRVQGNPERTTFNHYDSPDKMVSAGIWQCQPGKWRIQFAADKEEFFAVLAGRVRVADAQDQGHEVGPGEALVIPAGFTGSFEVIEAVRKYYVIVDRSARVAS